MTKTEVNGKPSTSYCCCFPKQAMADAQYCENNDLPAKRPRLPSIVPFSGDLPNNLTTGNVICVRGFVLPNCIRFSVNLICGEGPEADIAFHFNPRLDRNYIVRNCRKRGQWDKEETSSAVKSSIERNKKFDIAIFIAPEEFLISVNGKHFCAFTFRIPLNLCKRIEVHGLVDVVEVEYKTWPVYPERTIDNTPFEIATDEGLSIESSDVLPIPYTGHLPNGFQEGWQLEICGRVKLLPHSFYINLQDGVQLWPHPIIPLHLNPRFNTAAGENVFIRNAQYNGIWGSEERTRGFQFSSGSPFSLAIRRGSDRFSVWIDGQLSGEFQFRGDVNKIDTVYIQGDVIIKQIVMHEKLIELFKK